MRTDVRGYTRANGQSVRGYAQDRQGKASSGGRFSVGAAITVGAVVAISSGTALVGVGASGASLPSLPDISIGEDSGGQKGRDSTESWERKGEKYVEHAAKADASCVIASHGHVQLFLAQVPCRSLRRYIFAGEDISGHTAVVSLVKVTMYNRTEAIDFKHLLDRPASGDITPLGADVLERAGITFTGLYYKSELVGSTVVAAEAEPDGGPWTAASLKKMAAVALAAPDK